MSRCIRFSALALAFALTVSFASNVASAQEYKVEKVDQAAPADAISAEIAALLQPTGLKFLKGESRTVCELWLCKEWPVKGEKAAGEVIYPLQPGQVVGVIRYPRKTADFRDSEVAGGVYVLRYGHQPVDGAHVGTSPTRDFLVLTPAAKDKSAAILEYKPLTTLSKEVTGATHPAILSLQRLSDSTKPLEVRHNEAKEWWILRFMGKTNRDGKASDQAMELVLVGKAEE